VSAFVDLVALHHPSAVFADGLGVLMVNVGRRCDLSCTHCHHDAGPDRTEAMTDEVWERVLTLAKAARPELVDLTGGAPELHPLLAEMVVALADAGLPVRVRTNLVALLEPTSVRLPETFAEHGVEILASFPSADRDVFDAQRGVGSFERSLEVLRLLNRIGYATGGQSRDRRPLHLNLAVNTAWTEDGPAGPDVESALRVGLGKLGISFDDVLVITNVPVGRFADALERGDGLQPYLDELRERFNPDVIPALGCRCGITVSWDGSFADCDFNLGAGLACDQNGPQTIFDVELDEAGLASLAHRRIRYGVHCLACAAGSGSS
jgi:radical SAM/Cys-rich protein